MNKFFAIKSQYEAWLETNKDNIMIIDMMVRMIDKVSFVLVLYINKEAPCSYSY